MGDFITAQYSLFINVNKITGWQFNGFKQCTAWGRESTEFEEYKEDKFNSFLFKCNLPIFFKTLINL